MRRLIFAVAATAVVAVGASCARPQASHLPEFYLTHPKCIGTGRSAVPFFRCLSRRELVGIIPNWLYGLDPSSVVGETRPAFIKVLRLRKGYEPLLFRELRTGQVCAAQYSEVSLLSRDGETGELHIPVTCNGRRGELVWHLQGEFDRYIGLRWI
jgi:hypothetical protein